MASVYSVKQINAYIKNMFSQDFALNHIFIKGEVSNCKYHSSGHIYFTLKDGSGVIPAVMFAGQRTQGLKFRMSEGQQVIVEGKISVYERDGRYQMYANAVTLDGAGDLYRQFEELRDRLEEMGMFSPEYKQPIPQYARKIGIVTAPTGAAVQDMIHIAYRRNPYVQLYLYPAQVQGEGAAATIQAGIETLDSMGMDVIIIGRGGGSIEDLWAFNEEAVARAIFHCSTPILSAVGHETDVTISDYVADMRAPTPSAAAELAVFDYRIFQERLSGAKSKLNRAFERRIEDSRNRLKVMELRLKGFHPGHQMELKRQHLMELEDRLLMLIRQQVVSARHRLQIEAGRLHGLSPLQKLGNGYAYVTIEGGKRLMNREDLKKGDLLRIQLKDGAAKARIEEIEESSL